MTAPVPLDNGSPRGVLSRRVTGEQRAALEFLSQLYPHKYTSVGAVLDDYSLSEAVATYRRAQELAVA